MITKTVEPENKRTSQWKQTTIGELCKEDRTGIDPTSDLSQILPYLSLEHVESITGRILKETTEPVEDEGRSTTFKFDQRHVLYGKLRPYLNKVALPEFEGRCTTELIPLLPNKNISRLFLAWILRRPETVEAAMKEKTGARMPRANMQHIMNLAVDIPTSIEEQDEIAQKLSAKLQLVASAKRACLEQLELLDAYAQKLLSEFPKGDDRGD